MKIYTRTGDAGETSLFGGGRVPKSHARVSAYGEVDELNAVIGVALAALDAEGETGARLAGVQRDLFALGAHLATPPAREGRRRPQLPELPLHRIDAFEQWMDRADEELEPLRAFILPGGGAAAAALHHARTVCRRAERAVVDLAAVEEVDASITRYLNRLSDLLFTMARLENARAGHEDVTWSGGS